MRYEPFQATEADWRDRMQRLRFDFGKWDLDVAGKPTVARGALVLSRREHDEVVRAAEAVAAIADRARARLAKDPAAAVALGVHPRLVAILADEPQGPLVTRLDFFRTPDGWQVSEFNDDCPGGYNEAIGLPAVLSGLAPEGLGLAGDLPDALLRLAPDGDAPLALLYATAYAEDLQVVELLSRLYESAGRRTTLASPAHVALSGGEATVLGDPVSGLLRFFPTEWLTGLPNWEAWAALGSAGVAVRNPLATATTQSKGIHAWLWENAPAADRAAVERLLPRTVPLDDAGRSAALARPERAVLKPAYGRMGEGVVLGRECPPEAWRKRVHSAHRSRRVRPYVVQERFDSVPVETSPGRTAVACLGAYVVGGRFAGYYSRMSPDPVVAYDAANVLTLVEGL